MVKVKIVIRNGTTAGQCFMANVLEIPDENGSYGYVTHEVSSIIPETKTYLIEKDREARVDPYYIDLNKPH